MVAQLCHFIGFFTSNKLVVVQEGLLRWFLCRTLLYHSCLISLATPFNLGPWQPSFLNKHPDTHIPMSATSQALHEKQLFPGIFKSSWFPCLCCLPQGFLRYTARRAITTRLGWGNATPFPSVEKGILLLPFRTKGCGRITSWQRRWCGTTRLTEAGRGNGTTILQRGRALLGKLLAKFLSRPWWSLLSELAILQHSTYTIAGGAADGSCSPPHPCAQSRSLGNPFN